MTGTFTQPVPDGTGGTIALTGQAFALDMITVGISNCQGTMDEKSVFWTARPSTRRSAWPDPPAAQAVPFALTSQRHRHRRPANSRVVAR
jgi:hypothetical protein